LFLFHASPALSTEGEAQRQDIAGTFACLQSQPDVEFLLSDILAKKNLRLVHLGEGLEVTTGISWGLYSDKLKAQADAGGHGCSLIDMPSTKPKPSTPPPDFSN
jgi:hypothetical protein